MISVKEALHRILKQVQIMPMETINLASAHGRVLARDIVARITQPPMDVSAMDGYAVRFADVFDAPVLLTNIGESAAGKGFVGEIGPGQVVRIFTGAPLPNGSDAIVIQENTESLSDQIKIKEPAIKGDFVRPAGLDFRYGDIGVSANRILSARDVGLAAAMNVPWLAVRRRPRIALLATGNEIVRPGEPVAENQIISSNTMALMGLIEASGGESIDLGIAMDDENSIREVVAGARGVDMLVTLGGASVGDHDLVRKVLGQEGLDLNFWQIAMRPGKPLLFGTINSTPVIGMPGNPVSSLVCGIVYLRPAIRAMLGLNPHNKTQVAYLDRELPANDRRQDYLRATINLNANGEYTTSPFKKQDSSMLLRLAQADCLVIRPPHAPAAKIGDPVQILLLDPETNCI